MFRIEIVEASDGITMIIEGSSEITYVDSAGETALTWMRLIGAKFVAETSYSLHLCERLHLPLTGKRAGLSATFAGAQVC